MNQRGTIATAGLVLALVCPPAYSQQGADESYNFGATDLELSLSQMWALPEGRAEVRFGLLGQGATADADSGDSPETQPAAAEIGGWDLSAGSYVWIPKIDGTVGAGSLTASIHLDQGDLLDLIEFAGSVHVRAQKDRWEIFLDVMYIQLGDEFTLGPNFVSTDLKQAIGESGIGYRVGDWPIGETSLSLTLLGGGRLSYVENKITITGAMPASARSSAAWIDPFIGGRLDLSFAEKWAFSVRGDVGGFGIGSASDLAWNLITGIQYEHSTRVSFLAGYRVLDYDYDARFLFDVQMRGPILAAKIRF